MARRWISFWNKTKRHGGCQHSRAGEGSLLSLLQLFEVFCFKQKGNFSQILWACLGLVIFFGDLSSCLHFFVSSILKKVSGIVLLLTNKPEEGFSPTSHLRWAILSHLIHVTVLRPEQTPVFWGTKYCHVAVSFAAWHRYAFCHYFTWNETFMFIRRNVWVISGLGGRIREETFLSPFFDSRFLLTSGTKPARYSIASAVNITSDKLWPPPAPILTK